MSAPTRRALLALPLLMAPAIGRAASPSIPPFPEWVGRTALVRGDAGTARLLLAEDGTGLLAVRLFIFCRALPVRSWRIAEDGLTVRYSRASALDPSRLIAGEAHILDAEGHLIWIEADRHIAEFDGFAAPDSAGRCG